MLLQALFDDYDISQHFTIRKIMPTLSAPVANNFMSLTHLNGANFKFSSLGQIEVKIEITIKDNIRYHLDELNKALYTKEPKKLIISDMPDRYLMCKLDGKVDFTSRFVAADATLTFISPDHFWTSTDGTKTFTMDSTGKIKVNNKGSAPALPEINVDFKADCGYLSITSPNGFLTFGNALEKDRIKVPSTETALNEEMHNLTGWTRLTDVETWVTDYDKITSKGQAKHDEFGTLLDTTTFTGLKDNWQGHAYVKQFDMGTMERNANNFKLRSRVVMQDFSGDANASAGLLIVVLDDQNKPIMTTSIYDKVGATNTLSTSFKVNSFKSGDTKHSKIIHNGALNALNGFVEMRKSGNRFDWIIHTDSVNTTPVKLKAGDKVKLKTTATKPVIGNSYHKDYRNREYTIKTIAPWPGHSKDVYALSIGADVIYHVYLDDIQTKTTSVTGTKQVIHTLTDNNLAQLSPSKVLIWMGTWGASVPYNKFGLNSVVIDRLYSTNNIDIENVFRKGDNLYINNKTGDVLLNGTTFQGFADYDNRHFDIDYAETELQVGVSEWATLQDVKLTIEERFL